jgi:chromosome segregation ATPase
VEFLSQVIRKEEKKLNELDEDISELQKEAESYQHKVQKMKSALLVAKTLRTNAEKTFSSLSELSDSLLEDPDIPFPASPTQRLKSIGQGLSETHTAHMITAQSILEQARQDHQRTEEAIDANGSLFHHINDSLTSRIELRS